MKEYYNIKEVSSLLQIPMSTLRYWDGEGLIHTERCHENNYRRFSLTAVMELGMVSFYRSLGIPLKELREMLETDLDRQQSVLEEEEEKLEAQIQKMYGQKDRICKQRFLLKEIERLKQQTFLQKRPVFPAVVEFQEDNRKHWERMRESPEEFVLVIDLEETQSIQYGVGLSPGDDREKEQGRVIWQEEEQAVYLECLLLASNVNERENNLKECLDVIKRAGWRPVTAAAQYLASGWREQLIDYYKLWVQAEREL